MTKKDLRSFDLRFPVALGSGLATALLFIAARHQSALIALLLAALSPLPVMIATLGFGPGTGLGAALAAALTILALIAATSAKTFSAGALLTALIASLIFGLGLSLPSWWLAWLAGSNRSSVIVPWFIARFRGKRQDGIAPETETRARPRCPMSDILMSAAAIAFLVATAFTFGLIVRHGSYEIGLQRAMAKVEPLLVQMLDQRDLPKNLDIATLTRLVVETMPATASAMMVLAFTANLWLSGRVVELSHRLARPWPDIPHDLRVPRLAGPLFIACIGLAFLHGLPGVIASIGATVLGILFTLQGLAVVHDLSRGMKYRTALLGGVYLALGLLMPWPLAIFALIGLIEAALGLRDRKVATKTISR